MPRPHTNPLAVALPHLTKRIIPLPPSTYIHGAKLSIEVIIAIVFLILISLLTIILICCICMKRRKMKRRANQRAKEAAESKQLKPRINGRNAKFFAPGLVVERERDRESDYQMGWERVRGMRRKDVEMGSFIGQGGEGSQVEGEVKRPERIWGKWKGVLRGEVGGK